ncbi:MAG: hypothetical protein CL942_09795 [Desulfovibrio sp.]|nr:hypothetical protein [Desulfovibrio sp.]
MTRAHQTSMGRRRCLRTVLFLGAGILSGAGFPREARAMNTTTTVVVIATDDRKKGVRAAMEYFGLHGIDGSRVALKANYNSADPFPASTHPDTLEAIIRTLRDAGARSITLPERSGMGDTASVLQTMGVNTICEEHGAEVVIMDDLDADGYVPHSPKRSHWKHGFLLARPFEEADKVIQTCCLKTHQYGGHFTMSLKNVVGAIAKYDPNDGYNYMRELHSSPRQRSLIAEIGLAFRNDLIIMDGLKAFVSGGPHTGKEVSPGVIIAGTDPVAVDSVGVAILRTFGTTREVMRGSVADQEQIKRAAELGVGISDPSRIDLVGMGDGADKIVADIRAHLA